MISIRCSNLGTVAACPASAVAPAIRIESAGKPANLGNGVHEFQSGRIGGREVDIGDIAARNDVDPEELAPACWQAWNAWTEIAAAFPDPETELALGPIVWGGDKVSLIGTADVVSRPTPSLARIGDWKSGWMDGDHEQQVKGYALLIACEFSGEVEAVEAVVINTRLGFKTVYRWDVAELESWWDRLAESVAKGADTYRPSVAACRWCRRAHECPARQQLVRSSSEAVLSINVSDLTPDRAAELLGRARLIQKAAEDAIEIVRAEVAAAGGSLLLSDGRTLQLTPTTKRFIRPAPAWPILTEQCGEALVEAVTVSKTIADKIVRARAGTQRGAKKATSEKLIADLEAADAFDERIEERLEIVRATAQIESPITTDGVTS
jgi:hypothetical protein